MRFAYSFDLKSESRTITGFGAKAAVIVAMRVHGVGYKLSAC